VGGYKNFRFLSAKDVVASYNMRGLIGVLGYGCCNLLQHEGEYGCE